MKASTPIRTVREAVILMALLSTWLSPLSNLRAQTAPHTGPLIVSQVHPQDSRGETVYELQVTAEKDQPVVPGKFAEPVPIKMPKPKYPASLKKAHANAEIKVEAVITPHGDVIDATTPEDSDPEVVKSALDAVAKYRMHPATLDGKPIAFRVAVLIRFQYQR